MEPGKSFARAELFLCPDPRKSPGTCVRERVPGDSSQKPCFVLDFQKLLVSCMRENLRHGCWSEEQFPVLQRFMDIRE